MAHLTKLSQGYELTLTLTGRQLLALASISAELFDMDCVKSEVGCLQDLAVHVDSEIDHLADLAIDDQGHLDHDELGQAVQYIKTLI